MVPTRSQNVLDEIHAVLARHGSAEKARLTVPHHPSRRELKLFGLPPDADDALHAIGQLESVGKVSVGNGGKIGIRLSGTCVDELGGELEAGGTEVMATADLRSGKRVAVDFCDPNATKALHVGHLRNLALGNALAATLRACGAEVLSQSQVGDVGRSMGEAMAGYVQFGDGQTPQSRHQKSDHFVGDCYSLFVRTAADPGAPSEALASDPALSREDMERDDLASSLIAQWHRSDPEAKALWRTVRDWAVAGQQETFERLGISFDCLLFESDFMAEIQGVGDELVKRAIATEAPSGAVLYLTGDSNYPHMVLRRPDGHSTQHLRYIALWHATRSQLSPGDSIEVMGDEWLPLAQYGDQLLNSLAGDGAVHPTSCLLHGMVTVDDRVVKSSLTTPWLIDELLDEAMDHPAIAEVAGGHSDWAERLAAATALGSCIGEPPAKRLSISKEALFNPALNPGWAMASAALTAWDPQYDGAPDPSEADRDYRFLVAQSQVHRQLARRACEELNPAHLVSLHSHLSRWFLDTDPSPRLARAMRTVSSVGLSSLGLPAVTELSEPAAEIAAEGSAA